ncbi:CinA family protein [Pedobacter sp.]|uniref:CinA family protein n=1 Tax=Pedobacter sp. TaxID=1411316 RepID=UPI00396CEBF0
MNQIVENCCKMLAEKSLSVAFAESATAGRACMEFSLCKDAGTFLKGGINCYDAVIKETLLEVPKELIDTFTPESAEASFAIAKGLTKLIDADLYVGVTGLTSPGGSETPEKPVGTMFFCGLYRNKKLFEDRKVFEGNAEEIILKSVEHIAALVVKSIEKGFL